MTYIVKRGTIFVSSLVMWCRYINQEATKVNIKKIILPLLAIAAASAFSGCSDNKTGQVSEVSILATNIAPRGVVFDWQEAYEKKLSEFAASASFSKSESMFELADIDGNGTPELIISPDTESSTVCLIYTAYAGEISDFAQTGSYGVVDFIPESRAIGYQYTGDGFVTGEYLAEEEGRYQSAVIFYNNEGMAMSGARITYEVNGDSISLSEYEAAISPYVDAFSVKLGRKYCFGDESVDYALHCSESWGAVLSSRQKELYKSKLTEILEASSGENAAFEIVDLDGNDIPELVISHGTQDGAECSIYYLQEEGLMEFEASCGSGGNLTYDLENRIFYAAGQKSVVQNWTMTGAELNGFKPSGSIMLCGRKYLLSSDNINAAFL